MLLVPNNKTNFSFVHIGMIYYVWGIQYSIHVYTYKWVCIHIFWATQISMRHNHFFQLFSTIWEVECFSVMSVLLFEYVHCTLFIKIMLNFGTDNWAPLFIWTTVPRYKQPWARLSSQTTILLVLSSEFVFKVTTKHSSWNHHLPLEKGYIHHFTATNFT